jgi:hypothetical protein
MAIKTHVVVLRFGAILAYAITPNLLVHTK